MGKLVKTFTLFLTLAVLMSCLMVLTAKPASAQNSKNPSISILYPTNDTVFNVSIEGVRVQPLYQTNNTISWAGFSIDGGANITCTGNVTDNSAYLSNNYQFKTGHPTLTLYANDTSGNWATPQTVTYTVYFHSDATSLPTSNNNLELSILSTALVALLVIIILAILLFRRHRKTAKVT